MILIKVWYDYVLIWFPYEVINIYFNTDYIIFKNHSDMKKNFNSALHVAKLPMYEAESIIPASQHSFTWTFYIGRNNFQKCVLKWYDSHCISKNIQRKSKKNLEWNPRTFNKTSLIINVESFPVSPLFSWINHHLSTLFKFNGVGVLIDAYLSGV